MSFVFRPSAKVEIDGQSLTAAEAGLECLEVVLALGAHGFAALELWPRSKFASAAPGAAVVVSLGDDETVLTGKVAAVAKRASSLRITGRGSAFSFKGKDIDVRDVGRQLNVAHVLEGSVQRAGDMLRINRQDQRLLQPAADDRPSAQVQQAFCRRIGLTDDIVGIEQHQCAGQRGDLILRARRQRAQAAARSRHGA